MQAHLSSAELLHRLRRFIIGQKTLEAVAAGLVGLWTGSVALLSFALLSGMDGVRVFLKREVRSGNDHSTRLLGIGALAGGGFVLLHTVYVILAEARPALPCLAKPSSRCPSRLR